MRLEFSFLVMHTGVVMALAIFGNLFLAFVILKGNAVAKQKISPVQLLLLHTCTADLLFAFLSLGPEIIILKTYPKFYAPEFACKLVRYLQAFPLYASPFLLVAISINRYQAICRPLVHYRSDCCWRPNFLGFTAWLLAFICSLPQLFIWHKPNKFESYTLENIYRIDEAECRTIYGRKSSFLKSTYIIWFAVIAWLLPTILTAIFYWKIVKTVLKSKCVLRQISNNIVNSSFSKQCNSTVCRSIENIDCNTKKYVENLRKRSTGLRNQLLEFDGKRLQTIRLTLTIVACNFFLWAPFCIINVVQAIAPNLLSPKIITYIAILGNLNSCVNPWIYIFFNRQSAMRAVTSIVMPLLGSYSF